MPLHFGKHWVIAIVVAIVAVTLGGLLISAVQRVRIAAERTSDI